MARPERRPRDWGDMRNGYGSVPTGCGGCLREIIYRFLVVAIPVGFVAILAIAAGIWDPISQPVDDVVVVIGEEPYVKMHDGRQLYLFRAIEAVPPELNDSIFQFTQKDQLDRFHKGDKVKITGKKVPFMYGWPYSVVFVQTIEISP